jgi:hypothetical protein
VEVCTPVATAGEIDAVTDRVWRLLVVLAPDINRQLDSQSRTVAMTPSP